jgi:hypothetical protein
VSSRAIHGLRPRPSPAWRPSCSASRHRPRRTASQSPQA